MRWKAVILSVVFFPFCEILFSQSLKLGTGIAIPVFQSDRNYMVNCKTKPGFMLYFEDEVQLGKQFRGAFGAEYARYGIEFDANYFDPRLNNWNSFDFNHQLRIDELNFPLLLKFNLYNDSNQIESIYLITGYTFRFIINSPVIISYTSTSQILWEGNTGVGFSSNEIHRGLITGIGADLNLWKQKTQIELRYLPFGNIFYSGNTSSSAPFGATNDILIRASYIIITLGFKIL